MFVLSLAGASNSVSAASAPSYTESNCFDTLGRLAMTKRSGGTSTIEQYAHDPAGNRTNKTLNAAGTYVPGVFTLTLSPESSPVVIAEGANKTFTLTRTSGNGSHAIGIKLSGVSDPSLDLTLSAQTVSFLSTDTTKTFNVTAVQDIQDDGPPNESFQMVLFVDCGGSISTGNNRTVQVQDDD